MAGTRLSVNLNKVAVLRNARGGSEPDLIAAARTALAAGCDGITVHPRPDRRHVRSEDLQGLASLCANRVELNLEGNPFAPARAGYPGFHAMCELARPAQATLVPDEDGQLTSDHGFDLPRDAHRLAPVVARLRAIGCRVSLFVDAGCTSLRQASDLGAQRIEIYTGPYAEAHAAGDPAAALAHCRATAEAAATAGLGVNAGHDLNQKNLADFLDAVPGVLEVSIGHALIAEALHAGLDPTVRAYLAIVHAARAGT